MKLSASNIAWSEDRDEEMYSFLRKHGFEGLEIAPTRIFPEKPYDNLNEAREWIHYLREKHGLHIPSIQSIWYGRQEKIFNTEERQVLIQYTRKAIDFAETICCGNLVFGCPRNRSIPYDIDADIAHEIAVSFFRELGEYATSHGTAIGMEANPPIYNTNFINDTTSAIELIKEVGSKGFLLNLDIGTMVENGEDIFILEDNVSLINHVHISEPGLKQIKKRGLHQEILTMLTNSGYDRFISIEMGKTDNLADIRNAVEYLSALCGIES